MKYFLGLDISTTGSKALLINARGNVVAAAVSPHTLQIPHPLWSEQDPHEWWQAASGAIRQALAESG
ncbi:MAG TPA: FGGY family carbohydrate kinase, partial [Anaerolineae bacterium]|nr:FGGY family carbohydrate kinase [Anaerolineae bacterium]